MTDEPNAPQDTPTDLRSVITFRLAQLNNKLMTQNSHFLMENGNVTLVEWRILWNVDVLDNSTLGEIAETMHIDKGQLSRRIKTMVNKGYITNLVDEEDHRKHHIQITPKGHDLVQRLLPMVKKRQEFLTQDIAPEDLDTFLDVLEKLEEASMVRELPDPRAD